MSASPMNLSSARRSPRFSKLSARVRAFAARAGSVRSACRRLGASAAFADSSSTLLCEMFEQRLRKPGANVFAGSLRNRLSPPASRPALAKRTC